MKALEAANMLAAEDDTDSEDDEPATPAPPPPKATKTKGRGTRKDKATAEGSRGEDEALKKRKPKSKPAPKVQLKQIDVPKSSISGGGEDVTMQPNDAVAEDAAEKEGGAAAVSEAEDKGVAAEASKDAVMSSVPNKEAVAERSNTGSKDDGKETPDMNATQNTAAEEGMRLDIGVDQNATDTGSQYLTFTIQINY